MAAAEQHRQKLSVFDSEGRLLWFSRDWMDAAGEMNVADSLGWRWLEMLATPEEEAKARAWIASPHDGAAVVLLCATGIPGDGRWVRAALVKRRVGDYWVAIGDNRLEYDDSMPGAPCVMLALIPFMLSAVAELERVAVACA